MMRSLSIVLVTSSIFGSLLCGQLQALDTAVFDGSAGVDTTSTDPFSLGKYRWEGANWTKNGGAPGQTAVAAIGNDGHVGGRGGVDMVIGNGYQVYHDHNNGNIGGLGDFKPRMDLVDGGSLTIKQGAALIMDSHSDTDGRWTRVGVDINLDNGLIKRTHSAPSQSGGKIIFGYHGELLPNKKISINITNGGRIENNGKMVIGDLDYFASQGGSNNGHSDRIEVAMTINNGSLDLTGGGLWPDYFGQADGDLVFGYEWLEGTSRSKEEKYSINFTGPGSIRVNPYFDNTALAYKGGIYAIRQNAAGEYISVGYDEINNTQLDLYTPITYQDLWNEGILQANGLSGKDPDGAGPLTASVFSEYFTTTGTEFTPNYTLTRLVTLAGDYNSDGKVDAADYVVWRNGGSPDSTIAGYNLWKANFGKPPGAGSGAGVAAVPEPGSLMLVIFGLASLWFGRRGAAR